jgi:hypothetical protein
VEALLAEALVRRRSQGVDAKSARNGPGGPQLVVGVVVPAFLAFAAAVVARRGRLEAGLWTIASLGVTGGLVLFLVWFVQTYIPT